MEQIVIKLNKIIKDFTQKLEQISEQELALKPMPHKWSKKEVIGHLVDSGQNNLRRFITGQYESQPSKIVYDQNFWVTANNYQEIKGQDIIYMWKLVNQQIANVLLNMSPDKYEKTCNTSKEGTELKSLEWLAQDYVKHLKHHLNQVIAKSFDIVYP